MDHNTEQILVVYSVKGTSGEDLEAVEAAVNNFASRDKVQIRAKVFDIPDAAEPGRSLGADLIRELDSSVGGIVFTDDLRPNVAYEMGYIHGRQRPLLLLTRQDVDAVWRGISDLAGAPLARLGNDPVEAVVHQYLRRLYTDLLPSAGTPVDLLPIPEEADNLIGSWGDHPDIAAEGPYGHKLSVASYEAVDFPVARNVLPGSQIHILLRALDEKGDYSFYARVRFKNREGKRRRVWLGVSSLRRTTGFHRAERQFAGRAPTLDWRLLSLDLSSLLAAGFLLGAEGPDYVETVRFRAGHRERKRITPIEVGFVGLTGLA